MRQLIPNQRRAPRAKAPARRVLTPEQSSFIDRTIRQVTTTNNLSTEEGKRIAASQLLYRLDGAGLIELEKVMKPTNPKEVSP